MDGLVRSKDGASKVEICGVDGRAHDETLNRNDRDGRPDGAVGYLFTPLRNKFTPSDFLSIKTTTQLTQPSQLSCH